MTHTKVAQHQTADTRVPLVLGCRQNKVNKKRSSFYVNKEKTEFFEWTLSRTNKGIDRQLPDQVPLTAVKQ